MYLMFENRWLEISSLIMNDFTHLCGKETRLAGLGLRYRLLHKEVSRPTAPTWSR
jgi:hypothetical protein